MSQERITIIVPVLNEAEHLAACLETLQNLRERGCELIVSDGGSSDGSARLARAWSDRVLLTARGRAAQMNAGAQAARGDIVWFLHADCRPPSDADSLIRSALRDPERVWGRFDVRLSGRQPLLRVVEATMNRRSRWSGIATGDQGIFVRREAFQRCGAYPDIALMEDIALSRALKRLSPPACLRQRLLSSSRRWEKNGILATIGLMWWLRLRFFMGADPARLARVYYGR